MFSKVSISKIFSFTKIKLRGKFSLLKMKGALAKDTLEIGQKKVTPPKNKRILRYFRHRNDSVKTMFRDETYKGVYDLVKKARSGDEKALEQINLVRDAIDGPNRKCNTDFKDDVLNKLARLYRYTCKTFELNQPLEYSPFGYHRIYRTIDRKEYQALMKGKHIVSPKCQNREVFVTNRPCDYVIDGKMPKEHYFVTFKDKDNFDIFLSKCFKLNENYVPNVRPIEPERGEYLLTGGYNINDVESIKLGSEGKILYNNV